MYVDIDFNHPPQILKQLQKSISKTLPGNLSSKEVSDKSKTLDKKYSNNSGFYEKLIYYLDNRNKNWHKNVTHTQDNMIQSAIFKNCENEYQPEVLHETFPET